MHQSIKKTTAATPATTKATKTNKIARTDKTRMTPTTMTPHKLHTQVFLLNLYGNCCRDLHP